MGGILTQFWLESWPTCPTCLRLIESAYGAHPVLLMMSKKWRDALAGQPQYGYPAVKFLAMSAKILGRFENIDRYRMSANLIAPQSKWASHIATALLVRSICRPRTPLTSSYAALGLSFQPDQLANDIMV
jgi:hypothetical protein